MRWKHSVLRLLALFLSVSLWSCRQAPDAETTRPEISQIPTTVSTVVVQPSSLPETIPTQPTIPEPEKPTLLSFLKNAILPVGSTMYVWGGGWNEEDTGAGIDAVTLGLNPGWAAFSALQDSSYDFEKHRYQIHDGLDCSGYVGWAVYNTLETENGLEGYVYKATTMAKKLAERDLGTYIPPEEMTHWQPGDIHSMQGHIWICIGMCRDGSVLLVHSRGAGVGIYGTRLADGSQSDAIRLARKIMKEQYPDWYARYPAVTAAYSYHQTSAAMRWSEDVLADPENLKNMTAEEIVSLLFP